MKWIIAPTWEAASQYTKANNIEPGEYYHIHVAGKALGARMFVDDVIYVDKENISQDLLDVVERNLMLTAYKK